MKYTEKSFNQPIYHYQQPGIKLHNQIYRQFSYQPKNYYPHTGILYIKYTNKYFNQPIYHYQQPGIILHNQIYRKYRKSTY